MATDNRGAIACACCHMPIPDGVIMYHRHLANDSIGPFCSMACMTGIPDAPDRSPDLIPHLAAVLQDEIDRAVSPWMALLRRAAAHVYRQQYAGKHEQDRTDAAALWGELKESGVTDEG